MSNVKIFAKNIINIDATAKKELAELTEALDEAFSKYDIPHSWIITTADLLRRYETLTGAKYNPKFQEDSII